MMNGGRTIVSIAATAALALALAPPVPAQAPPGGGCDPDAQLAG